MRGCTTLDVVKGLALTATEFRGLELVDKQDSIGLSLSWVEPFFFSQAKHSLVQGQSL